MANVPCRLFGIVARDAPVAVILRRGPTRWTRLSRWNLDTDQIEHGQWLHAKVMGRRSDLSPDGSMFVYFASDHSRAAQTWTAISVPPAFTALAFWKKGDSWGGGGLFKANAHLWLNHSDRDPPEQKTRPRRKLIISNEAGGEGEDYPIFELRLERHGWKRSGDWTGTKLTARRQFERISPRSETNS